MKIGMRQIHFFILLFVISSLLFHSPSNFEAFAIDYPTHVGSKQVASAAETTPRHITFNTDGTKM